MRYAGVYRSETPASDPVASRVNRHRRTHPARLNRSTCACSARLSGWRSLVSEYRFYLITRYAFFQNNGVL